MPSARTPSSSSSDCSRCVTALGECTPALRPPALRCLHAGPRLARAPPHIASFDARTHPVLTRGVQLSFFVPGSLDDPTRCLGDLVLPPPPAAACAVSGGSALSHSFARALSLVRSRLARRPLGALSLSVALSVSARSTLSAPLCSCRPCATDLKISSARLAAQLLARPLARPFARRSSAGRSARSTAAFAPLVVVGRRRAQPHARPHAPATTLARSAARSTARSTARPLACGSLACGRLSESRVSVQPGGRAAGCGWAVTGSPAGSCPCALPHQLMISSARLAGSPAGCVISFVRSALFGAMHAGRHSSTVCYSV